MSSDAVISRLDNGLATLILNRADSYNVLSPQLRGALIGAIGALEKTPGVRCLLIRAEGKAFMAGGDIGGYHRDLRQDKAALKADLMSRIGAMNAAIMRLRAFPFPVVAAVQGAVAGAGVSLMLACDLALAADDARFTMAYSRIGTTPDCSGSYFLPRLVGLRKATELLMLSERFDAAEALRLGLVNRVVPAAGLAAEGEALARHLAAMPTKALAGIKRLLAASLDNSLGDQLATEAQSFADCAMSDDFREGVDAFVEKRHPEFSGR